MKNDHLYPSMTMNEDIFMDESRKIALRESFYIAIGIVICSAVMVGVFALLGKFDLSVLWGALVGSVLTVLNFFAMAIGATLAADKAKDQNVTGGRNLVRISMILRYAVLALILYAFAKSGICNLFALVIPLLFVRPVMLVADFFKKKR